MQPNANCVEATAAVNAAPLAMVKKRLNISLSETTEDDDLDMLISAATKVVELKTARTLVQRSFVLYLNHWPGSVIEIPTSPLVSVDKIEYYDYLDNTKKTLPSTYYNTAAKATPGYVQLADQMVWPQLQRRPEAVEISFKAGFATTAEAMPAEVKLVIATLCAHWYLNREPVSVGTAILAQKIPKTFDYVLNSIRVMTL